MLYSARGVGKTYTALGLGLSVAAGASFLRWSTPRPRRVLYLDGEMPGNVMRERISAIVDGMNAEPDPDLFRLITPDLQSCGIPSLDTRSGQAAIESELASTELLILDNLSTLCRGGKENEGESWLPIQAWALDLRRRGVSVLFVHHAGKAGAQRGTSRREYILDTVLCLRHSKDYSPEEGAKFEVHFEKARGVHGDALEPFEAQMETRNGACIWTTRDLTDVQETKVRSLLEIGDMSIRDIADETRVSKSKVHRIKNRKGGRK